MSGAVTETTDQANVNPPAGIVEAAPPTDKPATTKVAETTGCCAPVGVFFKSLGTKAKKAADFDKDGDVDLDDARKAVQSFTRGVQTLTNSVNQLLDQVILCLRLLKLAESSTVEGAEPSADAIAKLDRAIEILTGISKAINAAREIATLASEITLKPEAVSIKQNAETTLALNVKIRGLIQDLAAANIVKGIDTKSLDDVDVAARKMLVLYRLADIAGLTASAEPVVSTDSSKQLKPT